ncbi:proteasome non-ATPase 26S subunit-domain-containing protein, partial [Dichotomocladium elegans]
LEEAQEIFARLPLAQFYVLFGCVDGNGSREEEEFVRVLCQVVSRLLHPYTYDMILQDENNKAHSDLFMYILVTIAFQETRVATKAIDVAAKIGVKEPAAILGNNANVLKSLMETSSTVQFRVYDLVIRVAGSSDEAFAMAETSSLLDNILQDVKSDDTLLRLNAIDVLREVSITPAGLAFLEKSLVLQNLASFLDNEAENDTDAVAIAVVGLIGSHYTGLLLVRNNPLFNVFVEGFRTSSGDLKSVYLQSLSKVIGVRGDHATEQLTQDVYLSLDGRPTTLENLIHAAKQPVDEIRVGAFSLMQSIASHTWGQQQWKYAIIETLGSAENAQDVLGQHYQYITQFIRQGPFYRPTEAATAVESA